MLDGKRVAVVVPAHDEEKLIAETVGSIPYFVDRILVVDDASRDKTAEVVRGLQDPRVELIVHERNLGVGGAIVTGYKRALEERIDVTAVMAADAQMDPADLETLCAPVARREVDYAKANRLFTGQAWEVIPRYRYLGNALLSLLTKIASGYWHVADSQSGYTAISLDMLELLDLDRVYTRYGFPNDMLVHLNIWNARVRDYPSRPIYGVGERSGIRLRKVVPSISWLLVKGFFWRLREKYVIRDFHPLVFFYLMGILMSLLGLGLGIAVIVLRAEGNAITAATVVLVALLLIFGSQFTLFAMWFDMESNKDLGGRGRRRTDADLVHAMWLAGGVVALFSAKPFVVSLLGSISGGPLDDFVLMRRAPWLVRWICHRARATICISEALVESAQKAGIENIRFIPIGIEIPETVGEEADPPEVFYTGRLSPEKGVQDLAAARDGLNLIVSGDGVCAEAMAYGNAVVAGATGGLLGLVRDGETGLLVEPGNPKELRAAIDRLLADPVLRKRLGENARRWITELCSWDHVLDATIKTYEQALGKEFVRHPGPSEDPR